jgi:hypothetical protein
MDRGGKNMSFDFELSKQALDSANKRAKSMVNEVRTSLKMGSDNIPDSLKIYNRCYNGDSISTKQYTEDKDVRDKVEYTASFILATKWEIDRIFDINIEDKYAAKVTDILFYLPDLEEELEKRVEYYNMVLHVIQTAHYLTDEKINRTRKIFEALKVNVPKELELAEYVRENYQINQHRKALKDAVKTIFPSINNDFILDEIATSAL